MTDDPQDQFQRARALHQRGMFVDAEMIYHVILQRQPDNVDVLHLAGILALQTGRPEQGVELIGRALLLRDDDASAHGNLGLGLRALRRHAEALASHERAIALRPDFAQAYSNRGLVLAELQRHEEALASHDRAIALKPDFAEAHVNRGVVLAGLRRHAEALASFDRAIALKPDNADLHGNRARLLTDLRHSAEALASYDQAIALRPDFAEAHYNRAKVLADLRRPAAALAGYDRAIALKPDYADAYVNRAVVLAHLQRHAEALASIDRAIALTPDDAEAHFNRGRLLADLQRHEAALASYASAIALRPDYAEAHWNQSHCLLTLGRFVQGWRLFEWRHNLENAARPRAFPRPLWLGEASIAGKTLFIHWEQGLGDTIQFCRYATLAQALGAQVVLSVQDPLRRLVGTLGPDIKVIGGNEVSADFDCHCPMMSLPLACGTTLETIPQASPYLAADADAVAAWRGRLAAVAGLRVGLCWAGNPRRDHPAAHAIDRRRSIALAQLRRWRLSRARSSFRCRKVRRPRKPPRRPPVCRCTTGPMN